MTNEAETPVFPHAVLLTDLEVPSPIFAAALTGSARQKIFVFDRTRPVVTWPQLVVVEIKRRREIWRGYIPGFGGITGFVINFRADRAVRFTELGEPTETFSSALRVGSAELRLSTRILAKNGRSLVFGDDF
jgi:hypothetical protein